MFSVLESERKPFKEFAGLCKRPVVVAVQTLDKAKELNAEQWIGVSGYLDHVICCRVEHRIPEEFSYKLLPELVAKQSVDRAGIQAVDHMRGSNNSSRPSI